MINFFTQLLQASRGRFALFLGISVIIVSGVALYAFDGEYVLNGEVAVEAQKTLAEQKSFVNKQTKTSFGAVQGLTKNLLNLNSEITSRSLAQEEKDLKIANLTSAVKQRKILVKELMKENPRAFLVTAIKRNQRSLLPVNIQKDIEQETVITAKIEVLHIDDFENPKNSRFEYTLRTKDAKLNFYPTDELYLVSGAEVKINGFQLDDIVVSDINKQNFQVTKEAPPLESTGDQKTLVLLINFLNSPPIPFTKEQAYDVIFNGQFQNFMKEQSYGKVSFSGNVLDWVTLQRNLTDQQACSSVSFKEIEKIIADNNINLANYDRLVYLPNGTYNGCSSIGGVDYSIAFIGTVDFNQPSYQQPFEWTILDHLLSHELGHSLGVVHANGWDCGEQIMYGDCKHVEYGNYFDVMGHNIFSLHFNAFYKELLGWIEPENSLLIDRTGRYTVNPLETKDGVNLAKIQVKDSTEIPFYLEYRKGIGFDAKLNDTNLYSNQSGLFINNTFYGYTPDIFFAHNISRLLDMSPTPAFWWKDTQNATLNDQNVFSDFGKGVIVGPIINTNDSSIIFDVDIKDPVCVRYEPLKLGSFTNDEYIIGQQNNLVIAFKNQDSFKCNSAKFNVDLALPLNWTYETPNGHNMILDPEEEGRGYFGIYVPQNTIPSLYKIEYNLVNLDSGLKSYPSTFYVQVIEPPLISDINPNKGVVGTEVTLSGTGFHNTENFIFFSNPSFGSGIMQFVSSPDNKTLKFLVLSDLLKIECDVLQGCNEFSVPTPPGIYQITVSANGTQSNTVDFEVIEPKTPPTISGVSGPVKLKTNEIGTWAITANDQQGEQLLYAAIWGDGTDIQPITFISTNIFTHSYNQAGTYDPIFIVSNDSNLQATTTMSIIIENPPIFISAPKDGETVAPKSKITITAEVSDEIKDKTERVEFLVNGKRKCMDKTAPYSCNWRVPKKSGQTYELQAKAFDKARKGNIIAESEIIKVKTK